MSLSHFRGSSLLSPVAIGLFAVFSLYLLGFTGLKANVALNRNNDSWVHVAEADEFLRTGVFAKDPFIEEAPPFAVFGVQELMTAAIASGFTGSAESAWSWTLAVTVFVAAWAAFGTGLAVGGGALAGWYALFMWVSVSGWLGFHGQMGLHGLGFAFPSSVTMLAFYLAMLLRSEPESRWASWRSVVWGAGLGLLFGLHSLTGLLGVLLFGMTFVIDAGRQCYANLLAKKANVRVIVTGIIPRGLGVAAGFLALAWPWVSMQLALRPLLAEVNAQGTGLPYLHPRYVATLFGVAALFSVSLWALQRAGAGMKRFWPACVWVLALLLSCQPTANAVLAEVTSSHMAARVCSLAPLALIAAVAWRALTACIRDRRVGVACMIGVLVLLSLAPLHRFAAVHLYLQRTHDLDQHWIGHLRRLQSLDVQEGLLLSDPMTSYFARPMLGTYVVAVPGVLSSPVVPDEERIAHAKHLLANGADASTTDIDIVVFELKKHMTADFAGKSFGEMTNVWIAQGWRVGYLDDDIAALVPSKHTNDRSPER